jgi:hypothetical protein
MIHDPGNIAPYGLAWDASPYSYISGATTASTDDITLSNPYFALAAIIASYNGGTALSDYSEVTYLMIGTSAFGHPLRALNSGTHYR